MANYQYMMSADDVARELNCSKSHAYKLVKSMNEELASQGYITMAGRIPRAYWAKKMYGYELSVGYNSSNDRYGLLSSDLWIDTGFHCGECLEVLIDDQWVQTRMEMNPAREWYLVGTPYCGDLEYIWARIPE